jgi:hypothetical protein
MAVAPAQRRTIGRALLISAVAMFGLSLAFWQGLFAIADDARVLASAALAVAGLTDLGLGIYFLRQSR